MDHCTKPAIVDVVATLLCLIQQIVSNFGMFFGRFSLTMLNMFAPIYFLWFSMAA